MKKIIAILFAIVFLFSSAGFASPYKDEDSSKPSASGENAQAAAEKNGDIYILFTSDVHCGADKGFGYAGQQILDALEWGARSIPEENGGFLQVSGLSYEVDPEIPDPCIEDENKMFVRIEGKRRVKNVAVGDEPLDSKKTYRLAGMDYLLIDCGDGFTMFKDAPLLLDRIKIDYEVLTDYLTDTLDGEIGGDYTDPYGQGRITITG